jgi:hypothetical protein
MELIWQRRQHLFNLVLSLPLFSLLVQAQCNTDQNPYCRGNAQLEALCCPYPNVCYWSNRNGDPACCAYGEVCIDTAGAVVLPQPIQTQPPAPTTTSPLSTITSYVTHSQTTAGGIVVILTTTNDPIYGAYSTVTSNVAGAYSTVTSGVAGIFSTVTSDVEGGFETVTSTIGAVATEAASGLVQDINAAPGRIQTWLSIPSIAGVWVILWHWLLA